MAVNRADLAVFGVRGVEITRPKNFQVVKKTAQRFFRLAHLGLKLHCLALSDVDNRLSRVILRN
jgi:hypothetical protein